MLTKTIETIGVGDFKASPKAFTYINDILKSGRLSYGPYCQEFERRFAKAHDCKYGIFTNSGTSALQIALQSLKEIYGWNDGDEVLVPATTFVATANIVLHNRMKPVFVDVNPQTYNIEPGLIQTAITSRTRAIIPVNLMGLPAPMQDIYDAAKAFGLKIIEDSCECMFTDSGTYGPRKSVGSWGDIGCFSTYMSHFIVTGVGGICTTNNPEIAQKLRSLMNHGRDNIYISIDDDNRESDNFKEIISKRFKFDSIGHSFRATEFEAALGLVQLEDKDNIVEKRKHIAQIYSDGLKYLSLQIPIGKSSAHETEQNNVYMLYPIVTKESKYGLVNHLEENGIETRDLMPLINQPCYKNEFKDKSFPVSEHLLDHGFYIGCHQYITDEQANFVVKTIKDFYK